MALADRIRDYIAEQYLAGDQIGLTGDTLLLDLNVIDSVGIFDLMRFVSTEVAMRIPLAEVNADNFRSIDAMVQMVERLQGAARA